VIRIAIIRIVRRHDQPPAARASDVASTLSTRRIGSVEAGEHTMTVTHARWFAMATVQADPAWSWQVALFLAGVAGFALAVRDAEPSPARWVLAIVALLWLSMAAAAAASTTHGEAWPRWLAWATALSLQGLLFAWHAWRHAPTVVRRHAVLTWVGIGLAGYALAGRPILAWATHAAAPGGVGIAPSPGSLVAYTIGVLLLTRTRVPRSLLVMPLAIALTGPFWAATSLPEGVALASSGVAGLWLMAPRDTGPRTGQPARSAAGPSRRGWSLHLSDDP